MVSVQAESELECSWLVVVPTYLNLFAAIGKGFVRKGGGRRFFVHLRHRLTIAPAARFLLRWWPLPCVFIAF